MKQSEINHLRMLLGWVRTEIGPTPEELVATMKDIASRAPDLDVDEEGKRRMVEAHDRARAVPKYVRAAEKALSKMLGERGADVVDGEAREVRRIGSTGDDA